MSELHEALKTLAPVDFSSIPLDDLASYLSQVFKNGQTLVDSVPIPPPDDAASKSRSRSDTTTSIASSASEIAPSPHRISSPATPVEAMHKQWGKPIKLKPQENPLGISVYKLSAKDSRGAWFARRSVHEGLGFTRWKQALEREMLETLKVQGKPGEGNIRGIGGERLVEHREVKGVGSLSVFHLSAQFPGPTAPRDFVTLMLASDSALDERTAGVTEDKEIPRHFMLISKPCNHPDCPERDGYVRGQYESIEFIREIPVKKPPKRAQSTDDLPKQVRKSVDDADLAKVARIKNAESAGTTEFPPFDPSASTQDEGVARADNGRRRGKTISFAESRGADAKGEYHDVGEYDDNPVEWIMITRSDPGGNVPRFMVERGTPGAVVADASKFLDWACTYEGPEEAKEEHDDEQDEATSLEAVKPAGASNVPSEASQTSAASPPESTAALSPTRVAFARKASAATISTVDSFTTAEDSLSDHSDDDSEQLHESSESQDVGSSDSAKPSTHPALTGTERDLIKANEKFLEESRKREEKHQKEISRIVGKIASRHDKESRKAEKEAARRKKNEEKARKKEVEKQEKEMRKRSASKSSVQPQGSVPVVPGFQLKTAEDEKEARIAEMQRQIDSLKQENSLLIAQVFDLQRENTALTARIGKVLKPQEGQMLIEGVREDLAKAKVGSGGVAGASGAIPSSIKSKAASVKSHHSGDSGKEGLDV